MTLLYNFEKQKIENVPDSDVTPLVASGTYAPRRGVRIPVIAPDGTVGSIPAEQAQKAFLDGFSFQSGEDARARVNAGVERARQEAFGTSTSTALAAGALRGATFGLSDVALRAIGGEQVAEGLQATRELQPVPSTIGEVGGAVAGSFVGLSPVSMVGKLGTRAAEGMAGSVRVADIATKGTSGQIAAEILAKGAGSAVEGAFYGAGELLTEAVLGDVNLTAQNAALVFGTNVLGGGLIGGLVPGAATGVKKGLDKLGDILVNEMNVPAKTMDAFGRLISFVKISSPEQKAALKELAQATPEARAMRERVFDLVENPQKASQAAFDATSALKDVGKQEASLLGNTRESVRESLERVKYTKEGDKLSEVQSVTSKLSSAIDEAANKSNRYAGGAGQDLTSVLDELITKAKTANNLAEMHKAIHDSRMLLDELFEGVRKDASATSRNTAKLIGSARKEMNNLLHSEKMFPGVGQRFMEADAAFSQYLTLAKEFKKAFEGKVAVPGGVESQVKRTKAAGLVKSPMSDLAQEKQAIFDAMGESITKLSKVSGVDNNIVAGINESFNKVKVARQAAILLDRLEAKTGRALMASATGYALGTLGQELGMFDVPGAGIAGLAGGALLANPKTVMTYLMRLERSNVKAANAIDEAAKKYLGTKVPPSVSGALGAVWRGRKMSINELARQLEREPAEENMDDHDIIKSRSDKLQDVQELDNVVKAQYPLLDDIAPNLYAEKVNTQQRAMSFLRSKFPQDRDALFAGRSVLSVGQRIKLDRYATAAMNPAELLHEMASGSVRPETVEAVRSVYPDIYASIQKSLTETLADPALQRSLSRQKKNELSKVLGIATTESLQNIELLQQSWSIAPGVGIEGRGMNIAEGTMAPSEALQSRMGAG